MPTGIASFFIDLMQYLITSIKMLTRLKKFITTLSIVSLLASPLLIKAEAQTPPTPSAQESTLSAKDEALYLETYGWILGKKAGLTEHGITQDELALIIKGFKAAGEGAPAPADPRDIRPQLQAFLNKKAEAYEAKRQKELESSAKINEKNGALFIAELVKKNPKIKKTSSGLYYEIIKDGVPPKPTGSDKVEIKYTGTLIDGTVFDTTDRTGDPLFLEANKFIPGVREGLELIGEGGKIKLYIPASLAYGNADNDIIPPGSTLIFDIEIERVVPAQQIADANTPKNE
jgi:FKBP-type peptidyl-prolyl cis-trans isomerase